MHVCLYEQRKVWMDIHQDVNIGYLGREGKNSSCLIYISLYCFTCFNIHIFCNLKNKIKGEMFQRAWSIASVSVFWQDGTLVWFVTFPLAQSFGYHQSKSKCLDCYLCFWKAKGNTLRNTQVERGFCFYFEINFDL